jgi:hypothetical protein
VFDCPGGDSFALPGSAADASCVALLDCPGGVAGFAL